MHPPAGRATRHDAEHPVQGQSQMTKLLSPVLYRDRNATERISF
jgi:hypothetical protein